MQHVTLLEADQQQFCNPYAENSGELRKVRKTPQEYLDENLLRNVPVKVTYTAREGVNALEPACSGAGGSMRMTVMSNRLATFPVTINTTERMRARMREIQENAVLLQGLRRQSNPDSAMRTLVMQAMKAVRVQEAECGGPSVISGQDQYLMMHPALEKASSVKEERAGGVGGVGAGPVWCQPVNGLLVAKQMPVSLGTRAIS